QTIEIAKLRENSDCVLAGDVADRDAPAVYASGGGERVPEFASEPDSGVSDDRRDPRDPSHSTNDASQSDSGSGSRVCDSEGRIRNRTGAHHCGTSNTPLPSRCWTCQQLVV